MWYYLSGFKKKLQSKRAPRTQVPTTTDLNLQPSVLAAPTRQAATGKSGDAFNPTPSRHIHSSQYTAQPNPNCQKPEQNEQESYYKLMRADT
jgi:hypothetical protein